MTTPAELAVLYTDLDIGGLAHLQRLLGSWGVLSDLSFSDLLLLSPVQGSDAAQMVVIGQVRPTTSSTLMPADMVGERIPAEVVPMAVEALRTGELLSGVVPVPVAEHAGHHTRLVPHAAETGELPAVPREARLECVPVRCGGRPIAVMQRISALESRRRTGRLERIYRDLYHRIAVMVATGHYPFAGEDVTGEDAPRVGDGLVLVDGDGRIIYSSPNAMSALHRMGVSAAVEGSSLSELGLEETAVDRALASGHPVIEEVERRPDVIVLVHCTPLLAGDSVTGGMVLLRDVTDLRRLDRLLLSKDAAIREVHHRVKNNLQTISSLLSLQARRLEEGKGREALREAERRVRSIAVVHEILSRDPGEQVPFADIVGSLVRMAHDSVVSSQHIDITVTGDIGEVAAGVATPLAVVLAEILQNAVEHAFGATSDREHGGSATGRVDLLLANDGERMTLQVRDDGKGLPDGFDIEKTTSLGLSIVRDLVTTQLGGQITMERHDGTLVSIDLPVDIEAARRV